MRIFFRTQPRAFILVSNGYALTLQAVGDDCLIDFQRAAQLSFEGFSELVSQQFQGLIGVLRVKQHTFFLVVTGSRQVGSPRPSETVYNVKDVETYCLSTGEFDTLVLNRFKSDSHTEKYENDHPCSRVRKVLTNGFYYSRDFDLTNVLQERGLQNRDYHQMFNNYERRYLWNTTSIQGLINFRKRVTQEERDALDRSEFLTFLIRGFVKTHNVTIDGEESLITVISRISNAKASGAFGITGVDEEGHVCNYIESELLFYTKNHYFSYAQVRGNVPIFYELENPFLQNKKIHFSKSKEMNAVVFDKHFDAITTSHGQVYVIDALKKKSGEEELSNRYDYFVRKRGYPLINAPFTRETLKKSPHKLSFLVRGSILEIGAFCYDIKQKVYIGKQLGIFRINTLTSMEKPGMIEKIISKEVVDMSLSEMGLSLCNDLGIRHNMLWDENNETLMAIYDKSVRRHQKKSYRSITNGQVELIDPVHDYISQELVKRRDEYSSSRTIRMFAGTFNVNAMISDCDLSSWIFPHDDEAVDIVVVGLQEVVELTTSQMLNTDDVQRKKWEYELKKTLNQRGKYSLVSSDQLGGIVLMLFVKDDQLGEMKEVETALKKTGLGGMSANKGGVGLSFQYSTTRFCFVCAHLAAGQENVDQRHQDYKTISRMRFGSKRLIKDHDCVVWLGDFNFRVDLSREQVKEAIARGNYSTLFEHDQLNRQMISGASFPYFNEMEIKFAPTYKFDKGTTNYDTSEKFRTPAWTDRILSKGSDGILTQLSYGSASQVTFSDHRPVYATFDAKVVVIDEKKQDVLTKQLYERRKLELQGQPARQQLMSYVQSNSKSQGHGLPPPSTDRVKWWLEGGVKATITTPEGCTRLNPQRENNPFVVSDVAEFI